MSAHLVNVVIDAAQPGTLARFWAELLGWPVAVDEVSEVDVRAPEADCVDLDLCFVPVPGPGRGKNRLHLDLASRSAAHQAELVDHALALGGRHIDIGQGEVPWVVLADPEGNEFCVLEPRDRYGRSGALAAVVVDAREPLPLARFWATATGWDLSDADERYPALRHPSGAGPWVEFLPGGGVKQGKNRIHFDVASDLGGTVAHEVARLRKRGAVPADVGQGDVPWEVLADPEGNEFCMLTPR